MGSSRKERRQIAKNFGLLGGQQSLSQKLERFRRSNEMGKQFHLRHLEEVRNFQIDEQRKKEEIKILESSFEIQNQLSPGISINLNSESFDFLNNQKLDIEGSNE